MGRKSRLAIIWATRSEDPITAAPTVAKRDGQVCDESAFEMTETVRHNQSCCPFLRDRDLHVITEAC